MAMQLAVKTLGHPNYREYNIMLVEAIGVCIVISSIPTVLLWAVVESQIIITIAHSGALESRNSSRIIIMHHIIEDMMRGFQQNSCQSCQYFNYKLTRNHAYAGIK